MPLLSNLKFCILVSLFVVFFIFHFVIMELKLCTFNCCSLRKNIDIVRELTNNKYDIILLQKTFITEDKIGMLDFIDERYECIGVPCNLF